MHPIGNTDSHERATLRRRVIVGNLLGYGGMAGALVIYFGDAPIHPVIYALVGVAVGSGVGLAWLSLWRMRQKP